MNQFVNQGNTYRPDESGKAYGPVIDAIRDDGVCPFCPEHLAKYHKNPIDQESSHWLVTNNMYPYQGTRVHLLVIHKEHVEGVEEVAPEAWVDFAEVIKGATKRLRVEGASLLMRFGSTDYTGASVAHLHAQLVSGSSDLTGPPILAKLGNQIV